MKNLLAILLILAAPAAAFAADEALPSLDDVLSRYERSLGGRAAFAKHKTYIAKGTIEMSGNTVPVVIVSRAPDRSLRIVEATGEGVIRNGYNGSIAWSDHPRAGKREITGIEFSGRRRDAQFPWQPDLRKLYAELTVTRVQELNGKPVVVVTAKTAEGPEETLYFDRASGALVRRDMRRGAVDAPIHVEQHFEDFRPVGSLRVPFTVRTVVAGSSNTLKLADAKVDVEVEDSVFEMPK